jgi:hypothetical protein
MPFPSDGCMEQATTMQMTAPARGDEVLVAVERLVPSAPHDADLMEGPAGRVLADVWSTEGTWSSELQRLTFRGHSQLAVSARLSSALLDRELVVHGADGWELAEARREGARADVVLAWVRPAPPQTPRQADSAAVVPMPPLAATWVRMSGLTTVALRVARGWRVRWTPHGSTCHCEARVLAPSVPLRGGRGVMLALRSWEDGVGVLAATVADGSVPRVEHDAGGAVRLRLVEPSHWDAAVCTVDLRIDPMPLGAELHVHELHVH